MNHNCDANLAAKKFVSKEDHNRSQLVTKSLVS